MIRQDDVRTDELESMPAGGADSGVEGGSLGSGRSRRAGSKTRIIIVRNLWRLALVAVVVVVWEVAVNTGRLDLFYASKPSVIAVELREMVSSSEFWTVHVYATFKAIFLGMVIGSVSGIVTALILGRYEAASEVLTPFITALYSLPKIALAPLMLLWFGIGIASKVALVVSVVYFVMFYNTHAGVRAVDRDQRNAVRMLGSSEAQLWRYVILPSTTPWIMAGMRVSMAFAFTAAVVGELIASQYGLGNLLARASGTFQTGRVFALLTVLGVLGVVIYAATDRVERRMLRWRGDSGSSGTQGRL